MQSRDIRQILENITKGKTYITNLLKRYKENDIVKDDIIKNLLIYHPIKPINASDIEYLVMKKKIEYNVLSLHYKLKNDENISDISYVNCIRNLFGQYDSKADKRIRVTKAFRLEINDNKRLEFLENNTELNSNNRRVGICDNCNKKSTYIAVDHYKLSFKELMTTFIDIMKLDILSIEISDNYKLIDRELADKWLIYHDTRAVFRILCRSCNGHFGSYNY
jgi:hypothetical protein